jgi:DNA primase
MVTPDKNIWYDFSSNQGGDIFSFIMMAEGIDFKSALELLARKAGVDLSFYRSASAHGISEQKERLRRVLDLAATYYQRTLLKNQQALDYVFKKRKFSRETVLDFRLGYAPSAGRALVDFLIKKGISPQDIKAAGLSSRGGGDMFRSRFMVPLCDGQGQVIGFTARLIDENIDGPKYINTPQTILYDKSRHVFGLHQAKAAIRKAGYSVIVEGNLDVVSSHQVGVNQVVATAGTALTESHLKALNRLSPKVRLAFDADKAGLAATERAIVIAQKLGVDLSIITLPGDAKDPDELIQKDSSVWEKTVNEAKPVVDWVLGVYSSRLDLKTAEGKRLFSDQALQVIKALQDSVEREHYLALVAEATDSSRAALETKLEQINEPVVSAPKKVKTIEISQPSTIKIFQDNLLALAVIDVDVRELLKKVDLKWLSDEASKRLMNYIITHPNDNYTTTPAPLHEIETYVKIVMLKAEVRYAAWSTQDRYHEAAKLIRNIQNEQIKKRKEELTKELSQAENMADETKTKQLQEQLNVIIKELGSAQK